MLNEAIWLSTEFPGRDDEEATASLSRMARLGVCPPQGEAPALNEWVYVQGKPYSRRARKPALVLGFIG